MAEQRTLGDSDIVEGDYSIASGYAAAAVMMDQWPERPTAIFCFSDMMALGALQALQEREIKVPEEVSVIGFDGIDFSTLTTPPLSTVAQPARDPHLCRHFIRRLTRARKSQLLECLIRLRLGYHQLY